MSVDQSICENRTLAVASASSDSLLSSPFSGSDMSDGMGEEVATSGGKPFGTCVAQEDALAGAKSSSVKTLGLNGWIPVALNAEHNSSGVIDLGCTDMYS